MLWIKKTKNLDYQEKPKKKIKKDFYIYPKDNKNSYLVAWPSKYEEDYVSYKKGLLTGLKEESKKTYKNG